jgi:Ca2+-binding EF-hand superfamily protein
VTSISEPALALVAARARRVSSRPEEVGMSKEQKELVDKVQVLLKKKFGDSSMGNMRKLFDEYDRNRDGKIDSSDLEKLLKDADIGNSLTRGMWVKGIFEKMDTNRDKFIDWNEFSKAVE